jgi:hypothetical protein
MVAELHVAIRTVGATINDLFATETFKDAAAGFLAMIADTVRDLLPV